MKSWQFRLYLMALTGIALLGTTALIGCGSSGSSNSGLPNGAATRDQVLRGRYLVTAIGDCAGCHSRGVNNPADPHWLAGYIPNPPAETGRFNVGGFNVYAANLTPDPTTGLGNWAAQDIFNALRTGKDKDGQYLCPPMPWTTFLNMTDDDIWSIVAYLRSLKPVSNAVPESQGPNPYPNGHGNWTSAYQGMQPLPAYPASNETNVP